VDRPADAEELLPGGNVTAGVVRVGDRVRRPAGPHTPALHALLAFLRAAGFEGAPRPLGIDDRGREVLSYVPGVDPFVLDGPVGVYVSGRDFDDGAIDAPDGTPVPLRTGYPHMADVRDRNLQRQQEVAGRIFAAIKADGRLKAVCIDDMQHVLEMTEHSAASDPGTTP
jgi:hypothetical protein